MLWEQEHDRGEDNSGAKSETFHLKVSLGIVLLGRKLLALCYAVTLTDRTDCCTSQLISGGNTCRSALGSWTGPAVIKQEVLAAFHYRMTLKLSHSKL